MDFKDSKDSTQLLVGPLSLCLHYPEVFFLLLFAGMLFVCCTTIEFALATRPAARLRRVLANNKVHADTALLKVCLQCWRFIKLTRFRTHSDEPLLQHPCIQTTIRWDMKASGHTWGEEHEESVLACVQFRVTVLIRKRNYLLIF